MHINKINNKKYIGITCQNPEKRWRKGKGYKYYFKNAIQLYGWHNFKHLILASNLTETEAKNFEKILIDKLRSNNINYGYNLTNGGEGTRGYKHTELSKQKMSENKKGKYTGSNNHFYKKTHSNEIKEKFSQDRKGRKLSKEWKEKLRESHFKKIINIDTGEIFDSILDASKKYNVTNTNLVKCCKGKTKTCKGYRWMYLKDYENSDKCFIPLNEFLLGIEKTKYKNSGKNKKSVICLNTKEIFNSISEASIKYKISTGSICNCCKKKINSVKHPETGEPLKWMYYDEYIEQQNKSA